METVKNVVWNVGQFQQYYDAEPTVFRRNDIYAVLGMPWNNPPMWFLNQTEYMGNLGEKLHHGDMLAMMNHLGLSETEISTMWNTKRLHFVRPGSYATLYPTTRVMVNDHGLEWLKYADIPLGKEGWWEYEYDPTSPGIVFSQNGDIVGSNNRWIVEEVRPEDVVFRWSGITYQLVYEIW